MQGWLWAVNPAAIYNCAFWGQTDCVLLFFVLAVFWALHRKNALAASLCFALGCLSKLQMAYFAPFLLLGLALCCAGSAVRRLGALAAGAALGLAGWLPFMLGGRRGAGPAAAHLSGRRGPLRRGDEQRGELVRLQQLAEPRAHRAR